ncbi:MAG: 30S ribosomal protein S14 [bacterium]|nr:30S ribosomal protein S14 [bacterium]
MAKVSSIEKNKRRQRLVQKTACRRQRLKTITKDLTLTPEERFKAHLKLAEMPRNGAAVRVRNRCELTGRSRSYYRRFRMSRIAFRNLASLGQIPGVVKSSW